MRTAIFSKVLPVAVLAAGIGTGLSTAPATAADEIRPAAVVAPAVQGIWHRYYEDYFASQQKCKNRGDAMTTKGRSGYVPGAHTYRCYKLNGDAKWSMDIYWLT